MAITYPRSLITPIRRVTFDLSMFVSRAGPGGPLVQWRDPLWRAEFESPPLTNTQLGEWRAWWLSLRGGLNKFYAYDPKQEYPLAYPTGVSSLSRAGGGSFDGSSAITAIDATTITITNLPAGYRFTAGDKVGLVKTVYRSLHVVLESVTANGSGEATITVEPRIPTSVLGLGSTIQVVRPVCIMRVAADSWSNPTDVDPEGISFTAEQQGYA